MSTWGPLGARAPRVPWSVPAATELDPLRRWNSKLDLAQQRDSRHPRAGSARVPAYFGPPERASTGGLPARRPLDLTALLQGEQDPRMAMIMFFLEALQRVVPGRPGGWPSPDDTSMHGLDSASIGSVLTAVRQLRTRELQALVVAGRASLRQGVRRDLSPSVLTFTDPETSDFVYLECAGTIDPEEALRFLRRLVAIATFEIRRRGLRHAPTNERRYQEPDPTPPCETQPAQPRGPNADGPPLIRLRVAA